MKKLLLLVCLAVLGFSTHAQTVLFSEDFETVDSVFSYGNLPWTQTNVLQASGSYSGVGILALNDSGYLQTNYFSTPVSNLTYLTFDHICDLDFYDGGYIEISVDSGLSWIQLDSSNCIYYGTSTSQTVWNGFGRFSGPSYPSQWNASAQTMPPSNSWWIHEIFDISSLSNNHANVSVRFKLLEGNGSIFINNDTWYTDNLRILNSPCELIPPTITLLTPIWINTVYSLGPYNIYSVITDASGIANATLYYSINGGTFLSVGLINTFGNNYSGQIPAVNAGDTVCYYIESNDSSACSNVGVYPFNSGCISFYATTGTPYPYFDDFESGTNGWVDTAFSGSAWEYGIPNYGVTNSVHSGSNAWDVELDTAYSNSSESYLTSPIFDFSSAAYPFLSFWQNRKTEQGYDGFRIESTIDGVTWNLLGGYNDPQGTN